MKEREPLRVDYKGYRIVTAPPPSSGGVAIAEVLNILSGFDLTKLDAAHATHLTIEAMRRAFRDHNEYLGDPDFVKMPLDMLLSPYYADGLRATISPTRPRLPTCCRPPWRRSRACTPRISRSSTRTATWWPPR